MVWLGFTVDPWPQDLIDFFGVPQNSIVPAIIKAEWVDDHYVSQVKTPNGWTPLPDGCYLTKLNQGGALYVYDADTFSKQWKVVA